MDDQLRLMIDQAASAQDMLAAARKDYPGSQEDGRRRVLGGESRLEEVLRVTSVS